MGLGVTGLSPPVRLFDLERLWDLDRRAFRRAESLLADAERSRQPEAVVGIARGGRLLAHALARHSDARSSWWPLGIIHPTSSAPRRQAGCSTAKNRKILRLGVGSSRQASR